MEVRLEAGRLIATDERGHSVAVGVDGWQPGPVPATSSLDGDERLDRTGGVRRLTLPNAYTVIYRDGESRQVGGHDTPLVRTRAPVRIRVDSTVGVEILVVDTDGDVSISTAGERTVVGLRGRGSVGVSFQSAAVHDRPVVQVPRSAEGFARALSTVHGTTTTVSPDRTFPNARSPPARLQWADCEEVPESLRRAGTGVEIRVPRSLARLATVAPLAQYLGATVRTDDGAPRVVADGEKFFLEPIGPGRVLQTVFWLDCLARCAGPHEPEPLDSLSILSDLGLDAQRLFDRSMSARVRTYLDRLSDGRVPLDEFPEWHYGVSVEPTLDRLSALIDTLERLPIVTAVSGPHEPHDPPGVVDWTEHTALDTERIDPETGPERTHAWLADGVPIGGVKLLPAAFERRPTPATELAVVVVDNHENDVEATEVCALYRGLSDTTTVSTELHQNLDPDELAAVIREETDHLHFVGHCDDTGLRCVDDERLPVETVPTTEMSSFVLNACDSVEEAKTLVERGAVAGVATTRRVVTGPARTAGRECARLLANGWPVAKAIDRAEAAVADGETGYLTVGDGTYAITSTDALVPPTVEISSDTDGYLFTIHYDQPVGVGLTQYLGIGERPWLVGDGRTVRVERPQLEELLHELDSPVVFEGKFRWPEAVDL
ncbi:hypothetical protein [Halobaculum sp. MBLA0143]|uniref:hypothetical protein n=1 Tax=Halobaculum sp. MBLA0143 TaxID=3079933 RepID=UPI00352592DA